MIEIAGWGGAPVYLQIVDQVRLAVAKGRLKPGEKLEPVRQLAARLTVNPSTVARAYQVLEHDGIIATNRRRGSVVAPTADVEAMRVLRTSRLRGLIERPVVEALAQGFTPDEITAAFDIQIAAWRDRRESVPAGLAPLAALAATATGVRFAGSHDLALEMLWAHARRTQPGLAISACFVGSLDGLLALLHGEADLAGAHILDEESGEFNLPILRRLFVGQPLRVITLVERVQGLIVSPGNPLGLRSWADLARPRMRFINRQPGSGTRTLLDYHLRLERIPPPSIDGYASLALTHLAAAASVADGLADAGLGLMAAARAYGLGFVPLARERFDLVLLARDRDRPPIAQLVDLLATEVFRAEVAQLGGYDARRMGEETEI